MNQVLVLGTGYVVKPLVDYFIDKFKWEKLSLYQAKKVAVYLIYGEQGYF